MLDNEPLPFTCMWRLCDLARTRAKLAHCRTVVENTRKDILMNPPYFCMKSLLYRSKSYVTRSEPERTRQLFGAARTYDTRRQCI